MSERKGFNFYRSYFDVYMELEKQSDKVAFIDALLKKQFLGIDPDNLSGMAKFAYISQQHSIDQQVKGWQDKTGITLSTPPAEGGSQGGNEGGSEGPSQQEKGEEEEKEKGKKKFIPPTLFEVREYFDEKGYTQTAANKAYEYYNSANWRDSKGNKIKNWKQKMIGVWFRPENEKKKENSNPFARYGY